MEPFTDSSVFSSSVCQGSKGCIVQIKKWNNPVIEQFCISFEGRLVQGFASARQALLILLSYRNVRLSHDYYT